LRLYRLWLRKFTGMFNFYYREFPRNLFELNDAKLGGWVDKLVKFYLDVSMPGFIDGFMFYAD
jgi:hypothetical protein